MSDDRKEIKIGEFNGSTVVRVTEWKDKKYVDIRKYQDFAKAGQPAQIYPTKKGISVALDEVSNLIDLLESIEEKKQKNELNFG